jgi:DNA-binding transcriptional MerR regulator
MRTIGEVAEALGIKPHILRYWEEHFPMLLPLKRSGGRRLYRAEDVALVVRIDQLVNHQGYTLKGARLALAGGTADKPAAQEPARAQSDISVLARLQDIRGRLAAALNA